MSAPHSAHPPGDKGPAPLGPRARMAEPGEAPGFWDNPKNGERLIRALYVLSALLVVADLFVHRHSVHPWEHVKEFYPLYGFVGIVILVAVAKVLRKLVMRGEDYYDAR